MRKDAEWMRIKDVQCGRCGTVYMDATSAFLGILFTIPHRLVSRISPAQLTGNQPSGISASLHLIAPCQARHQTI